MLITNGTCVSTIVKSRAGRSGNRRRHDSLTREGLRRRCFKGEASMAPPVALIATERERCQRTWCGREIPLTSVHLRGEVLAVLQRRVDRRPPGDRCRELLRALVAHILELRDSHVLNARQPRAFCRSRGGERRSGHRLQGSGRKGGRCRLVLRDFVRRLARAGRDRCPAAVDSRARLLDVPRTGRERYVLPGEIL